MIFTIEKSIVFEKCYFLDEKVHELPMILRLSQNTWIPNENINTFSKISIKILVIPQNLKKRFSRNFISLRIFSMFSCVRGWNWIVWHLDIRVGNNLNGFDEIRINIVAVGGSSRDFNNAFDE